MVRRIDTQTTFSSRIGATVAVVVAIIGMTWTMATDRAQLNSVVIAQGEIISAHTAALKQLNELLTKIDSRLLKHETALGEKNND